MRTPEQLARSIDHALLHPSLPYREFEQGLSLCRELLVGAACVKSCDVRRAADYLNGCSTLVCSVVGFPHGNCSPTAKVYEAEQAIADGAREIDYVINVAAAVSGRFDDLHDEMEALNRAVCSRGVPLKVIFENAYLDDSAKLQLCRMAKQLRVAFVKTSTGFATGLGSSVPTGATLRDVELMVREARPECQVKASGGIRDLDTMERFLDAGATRIGTSATAAIIEQARLRMRST
jgi:deoxyribose-phosphate aldolase